MTNCVDQAVDFYLTGQQHCQGASEACRTAGAHQHRTEDTVRGDKCPLRADTARSAQQAGGAAESQPRAGKDQGAERLFGS